eukprot:TRINITY_DN3346_c0_g1_i1.p1 TRINITY_DN3346_c0_g1~~TRINITY_DN3346_c0_g1_i1.p1  ORF type:complete len:550 (-),score=127.62 TRINITY_DN3346_c0_g1_i1:991-2589(-)
MTDDARPKCAIFAVFNAPSQSPSSYDAATLTYYGLHALQHRGQESTGIATLDETKANDPEIHCHKSAGLVLDVFTPNVLTSLPGIHAIGHNRYATAGASSEAHGGSTNSGLSMRKISDMQPLTVTYRGGPLALAHNGNLSNASKLRTHLISRGILFSGTADSEIILHLMSLSAAPADDPLGQILEALSACQGAYSLAILTQQGLFAVRDPNGFRPLVLGTLNDGESVIACSETCGLDIVGAQYVREVSPGEIVWIRYADGEREAKKSIQMSSVFLPQRFGLSPCVFEYIYFARPDSIVFGESVHELRLMLGEELAKEHSIPEKKDDREEGGEPSRTVVIAVPDSSNTAALGYVKECKRQGLDCDYEIGLIRNHYVGRTFISPNQDAREVKVRCKFSVLSSVVKNNIVVLVDDSIVRGTTSKLLIKMVRQAGAKEVHFRVSSPPVISPCFYGMDFPSREELLANQFPDAEGDAELTTEKMRQYLGADSLAYLSVEGLGKALKRSKSGASNFCFACFTSEYPVPVQFQDKKKEW